MMSLMTSLKVWMFATGKLLNQLFQTFAILQGELFSFEDTNKFWSDLVYAAMKAKNVIFQLYISDPILTVNM